MDTASGLHNRFFWSLLLLVSLAVTVVAGWPYVVDFLLAGPRPDGRVVAAFNLIERSGRTVTQEDFRDRVWIAGCTFNCCTMSCPQIREAMRQLQDDLQGTRVTLVSLSVDPVNDTPEQLRALADSLGADSHRWLFLTATPQQGRAYVDSFLESSFKTRTVEDPAAEPGKRISHTNRLFLIDRKGQVRGGYAVVEETLTGDGHPSGLFQVDEVERERLLADARLVEAGPLGRYLRLSWFPTINACLNATSGLLLCVGYLLIRRRLVTAHATTMLLAVGVSALFLVSYLYYHAYHGATPFAGEGWIRPVYFTLLLSHTVLAALVVPMVLWTLYRAVRGQYAQHRRIARWTLPIWVYVSATGVLVYLFLYHFFAK